jgi:hypothetical protein
MPPTASPYDTGVSLALALASHPFHQKGACRFRVRGFLPTRRILPGNPGQLSAPFDCKIHSRRPRMRSHSQLQSVGEMRGVTPPAPGHLPVGTLRSRIRIGASCDSEQCLTKIWMDAYLAAFAIRSGISLVSIDNDLVRVEPQVLQFRLLPRDRV